MRDILDEHDLIVAVKNLATELGRTPTAYQMRIHIKNGRHLCEKYFGTYNSLLELAGLAPNTNESRKITSQIFEKDIGKHLKEFEKSPKLEPSDYPSIASISDIHWPFSSQKVIDRFLECIGDVKHEYIFINGDAWDMYSHSKFPRSHNVFVPKEEERASRESNEAFWKEAKKRSPKSKCIQMMGNHDVRPMKRVLEVYPEAEEWVKEKLTNLFSFEGVKTIMDPREEFMLGDIAIFHGYLSQLGAHRDFTLCNTINGHTHKGGTVFRHIRGKTLWELNSGFAGNPEAKGLTYTPQRINIWTPGFGEVDKKGPRFIAL